jgi:hypothetical protein
MQGSEMADERLTRCHGFAVTAGGRSFGSVERPVFAGASSDPAIHYKRSQVTLDLDGDAIGELPERLPLERH